MKRSYICQISSEDGRFIQKEFCGIVSLKKFLRGNGIAFWDGDFSYLGDECREYKDKNGLTYEIELLPDICCDATIDEIHYIQFPYYMRKYQKNRSPVRYAIKKGWLKTVVINGFRYIEDKEIEHR